MPDRNQNDQGFFSSLFRALLGPTQEEKDRFVARSIVEGQDWIARRHLDIGSDAGRKEVVRHLLAVNRELGEGDAARLSEIATGHIEDIAQHGRSAFNRQPSQLLTHLRNEERRRVDALISDLPDALYEGDNGTVRWVQRLGNALGQSDNALSWEQQNRIISQLESKGYGDEAHLVTGRSDDLAMDARSVIADAISSLKVSGTVDIVATAGIKDHLAVRDRRAYLEDAHREDAKHIVSIIHDLEQDPWLRGNALKQHVCEKYFGIPNPTTEDRMAADYLIRPATEIRNKGLDGWDEQNTVDIYRPLKPYIAAELEQRSHSPIIHSSATGTDYEQTREGLLSEGAKAMGELEEAHRKVNGEAAAQSFRDSFPNGYEKGFRAMHAEGLLENERLSRVIEELRDTARGAKKGDAHATELLRSGWLDSRERIVGTTNAYAAGLKHTKPDHSPPPTAAEVRLVVDLLNFDPAEQREPTMPTGTERRAGGSHPAGGAADAPAPHHSAPHASPAAAAHPAGGHAAVRGVGGFMNAGALGGSVRLMRDQAERGDAAGVTLAAADGAANAVGTAEDARHVLKEGAQLAERYAPKALDAVKDSRLAKTAAERAEQLSRLATSAPLLGKAAPALSATGKGLSRIAPGLGVAVETYMEEGSFVEADGSLGNKGKRAIGSTTGLGAATAAGAGAGAVMTAVAAAPLAAAAVPLAAAVGVGMAASEYTSIAIAYGEEAKRFREKADKSTFHAMETRFGSRMKALGAVLDESGRIDWSDTKNGNYERMESILKEQAAAAGRRAATNDSAVPDFMRWGNGVTEKKNAESDRQIFESALSEMRTFKAHDAPRLMALKARTEEARRVADIPPGQRDALDRQLVAVRPQEAQAGGMSDSGPDTMPHSGLTAAKPPQNGEGRHI